MMVKGPESNPKTQRKGTTLQEGCPVGRGKLCRGGI